MPVSRLISRLFYALVFSSLLILMSIAPRAGWAEDVTAAQAMQKAQQQFQQGDLAGALETLDTAIAIGPTYELYVMRGQARIAGKQFDAAIKDAETILIDRPSDFAGVQIKTAALMQQEKVAEAFEFINRHIERNPDEPRFPSAKAELLVSVINLNDEQIKKYLPDSSAYSLKGELRYALSHTIAASVQPEQKLQARVFAANNYAKVKEYQSANSALTHAINADKNNDPRLRIMRLKLYEQWGDAHGILNELESLQDNQLLKQHDPQAVANIRNQIETIKKQIDAEQGPVYDAVIALRRQPDDVALRDAVAAAVEQIEQAGEANPLYDELVKERKIKPLYPEPTLDAIKQWLQNPADIALARNANPEANASLQLIEARSAMRISPSAKDKAAIAAAYDLGTRMAAQTPTPASADQLRNRNLEKINLYPGEKAYRLLAEQDYLAGDHASAKRFALIAAGLAAAEIYEEPSEALGFTGITPRPARDIYRSAERFIAGKANPVETALLKAFRLAEQGEFLAAEDAYDLAFKLDIGDRDENASVLNPILRDFQYEYTRRYDKQVLDAFVDAALLAKQQNNADQYETIIQRIKKRYPYTAHANSRVLLSEYARQNDDERMSGVYLDSALSTQPLNAWANAVKGDRLNAAGQTQQAMLHYNAAANIGAATADLEGRAKVAGEKRDLIEKQLNLPVNELYGQLIDKMRAENVRANAGLVYAAAARMLRDYTQNKNLLKIQLDAAYRMQDTRRATNTLKLLTGFPVAPEIEPNEKAWAHRLHGRVFIDDNKDYLNAIKAFTASIQTMPEAQTYSARAQAYYKLHQFEQAVADVNQLVELQAATWTDYSVRAQSHEKLGNLKQASDDIKEALRLQKEAQGENNFGLLNVAQRIMIKQMDAGF